MRSIFSIVGYLAFFAYQIAIIYFFSEALGEFADVYSTLGKVLVFIGAMACFMVIPFGSVVASVITAYYLIEYEYWNAILAICFVFPGVAYTAVAFFGGTTYAIFSWISDKFRTKREDNLSFIEAHAEEQPQTSKKGLIQNYIDTFKRFKDFSGRTTRSSFWKYFFINFLILISLNAVSTVLFREFRGYRYEDVRQTIFVVTIVTWLILWIPQLAATVRRVRDAGYSTWFVWVATALAVLAQMLNGFGNTTGFSQLMLLASAIASFIVLVLCCFQSKQ